MQKDSEIHVGLDVHKDSISIAAAEPGRAHARLIGKVPHDVSKLVKVLGKIASAEHVHIVYEAGPTGFGLCRALAAKGYRCESSRPRRCRADQAIASRPTAATAFSWPSVRALVS